MKNDRILLLGFGLLLVPFITIVLSVLFFIVDISISPLNLSISFIISMLLIYFIGFRDRNLKEFGVSLLVVLSSILLLGLITSNIYDISWDGQGYHQHSIIKLKEGWNPLKEDLAIQGGAHTLYAQHYPKATWYVASAIYSITNNIESGKIINILFLGASFCFGFVALRSLKKSKRDSFVLAMLAAFNPITVTQLFSYYLDGVLSSLIVILLASLVLFIKDRKNKVNIFALIIIISIIVNLKFTAIGYLGIILMGALIYLFIRHKKLVKRFIFITAGSLFIGIVFIGFNPYVINTVNYGHPFHPLAGDNKMRDFMPEMTPGNLVNRDVFSSTLISIFSKSENISGSDSHTQLKLPLTIDDGELTTFYLADTRVGGMGPFYSAVFVLSTIILLFGLTNLKRNYLIFISIAVIIITVIVNQYAWWARYVPQLYLVSILAMLISLNKHPNILNVLKRALLLLLVGNMLLICYSNLSQNIEITNQINGKLLQVKEANETIPIEFVSFKSNELRLQKYGIDYKIVDKLECSELQWEVYIPSSNTKLCLNRK